MHQREHRREHVVARNRLLACIIGRARQAGKVPTLTEAVTLALEIGSKPRILPGNVAGTANVELSTLQAARKQLIAGKLSAKGWSYIHGVDPRPAQFDSFTVLVTL